MVRQIIRIEEEKCNGCGLCVNACHEGAISMIDGKAKLIRDDYCDGLGNCLPVCPTNAISFEEREADEYNEEEVKKNIIAKTKKPEKLACGCPGTQSKCIERKNVPAKFDNNLVQENPSELNQWPVQIKLVPPNALYWEGAHVLIAADCTAYAYGNFHQRFMRNKITIIGCPKLDEGSYAEKLTAIIKMNELKSITVVRMEVPCCSGIVNATMEAIKASGKMIPWSVVTISTDGSILED